MVSERPVDPIAGRHGPGAPEDQRRTVASPTVQALAIVGLTPHVGHQRATIPALLDVADANDGLDGRVLDDRSSVAGPERAGVHVGIAEGVDRTCSKASWS